MIRRCEVVRPWMPGAAGVPHRAAGKDQHANVDVQLQRAEQRANELSRRARRDLTDTQPSLATALQRADHRLAAAASALRGADSAAEVRELLRSQLGPVSDQFSAAIGAAKSLTAPDTDQSLETARDQIDRLRDQLPGLQG